MRRLAVIVGVLCLGVFACAQIADGVTSTTNINIGDTRIIHCRNQGVSVVAKNSVTDGQVSCVAPTTSSTTTSSTTTSSTTTSSTTTSSTTTTTTSLPPPPGGFPDATNTGVPAGTTLTTVNGNVTLSTAGQVYDAKNVVGRITVTANNVTIKRSKVSGGIYQGSNAGMMVVDTEIGPASGKGGDEAIGYVNFTCLRCNIHNFSDGVRTGGGVTIQDSWIHNLYLGPDDHNDGIQRYAPGVEGNDVIRHNTIQCVGCTTSAIFYADNWGPNSVATIDGNLLSGGGYTLRMHESGATRITNNVFVRGSYGSGAVNFYLSEILEWSNNRYDDGVVIPPKCASGVTVPCAGG